MTSPLPIDDVLPEVVSALQSSGAAVLVAPPGAGKTTRVPLALLRSRGLLDGQVYVLEPRRVATRAAARRMAQESSTPLGDLVGYQVRFDRVAGHQTRLMVVTEGILTRRLQDDPMLDGISLVILDEFHERSLHTDMALALLREVREDLRPDLKILVMSATMDPEPLARYLGDAPIVQSEGRAHPIDIEYLARTKSVPLANLVEEGVRRALHETEGDILTFLPGTGDIRATERRLQGIPSIDVVPLHGELPAEEQDRALSRSSQRRVVLATNVAETSLTLEGISVVVDSGFVKRLRHDPGLGLDRLELRRISQASATQRAGRAGRLGPGKAYRLWTRSEQNSLEERDPPEILRVDLASTVLELKAWGLRDPSAFGWYEAPSRGDLERAEEVLVWLGAIDEAGGALTEIGKTMRRLPVAPRIARMLVEAKRLDCVDDASVLGALLSERDIVRREGPDREAKLTESSDLFVRLDLYRDAERRSFSEGALSTLGLHRGAAHQVKRVAQQLRRLAGNTRDGSSDATDQSLRRCLLASYPDRVAKRRRSGESSALMVGGRGVDLARESVVRESELFLAVQIDGGSKGKRASSLVRWASEITLDDLQEFAPAQVRWEESVAFDQESERVEGRRELRYHDLCLVEKKGRRPDSALVADALADAIRAHPDRVLEIEDDVASFLERARCLRQWCPDLELPSLDEAWLVDVLVSLCPGLKSFAEVRRTPLLSAIKNRLTHKQLAAIERDAPARLQLPGGKHARLDYEVGRPPILAAKVQDLFGVTVTPRVGGRKVSCIVELLAPNFRPVQRTQDLESFWKTTYTQVRKDLRGRYPKHDWPERPPGVDG